MAIKSPFERERSEFVPRKPTADIPKSTVEEALAYVKSHAGVTDYNDLTNKPTLGTAAAEDTTAFATAAQGTLADSATQPGDLATVATSGAYTDLTGTPTLGTAAAKDADTDGTLAANSDSKIATQKAVKTYADQLIAAADVMVFKGVIDCSANPNYPAADAGWSYRVSVAGKIGGSSGKNVEVGDLLLCLVDSSAAGNQATVGANWSIAQTNIDGAVTGPASATSGNISTFSGTSGKIVQDSGIAVTSLAPKASPTFTGTPAAPTASARTNSTQLATTAYVDTATRERLTANRTYYVRTDGSDSNNGLTNSSGGAFLTIQAAIKAACAIDGGIFDVTIQVGSGTYTTPVLISDYIGSGSYIINGDTTTPSNCIISTTSADAVKADGNTKPWTIQGFKIQTTTSGSCIRVTRVGRLTYSNIDFGSCAGTAHVFADINSSASAAGPTTISGGATCHWLSQSNGVIFDAGFTITLTGTPAFTTFANTTAGLIKVNNNTFSGSATGTRYFATLNGVIDVNGGGTSYIPGNSAGSATVGGQYA